MGVAFGGKKYSGGVAFNGKKLSGIAYKGDIIYYNPSIKIVTFADGTDEEISAMLEAHYQGKIDIEDYWSVGDTRVVHINAIPSDSNNTISHVAQDITMVIIGINHDDLQEQIGIRTKAAITVQCRECLGNNGTEESVYYWGYSYKAQKDDNWSGTPMREWLNNNFVNAMPSEFNKLIKTVTKKNFNNHTKTPSLMDTQDKVFWLSYDEVRGYNYNSSTISEGNIYEYYKSSSNIEKYANNNGIKGKESDGWWGRTPYPGLSTSHSIDSYIWAGFQGSTSSGDGYGTEKRGLAPAFCI